jgi:flagellar biosynthesis/type III secretory pathway chaperone
MDPQALQRDIDAARDTLATLRELLEEERHLIETRQADALQAVAERKVQALAELQKRDPAARAGVVASELEQRIASAGNSKLSELWRAFVAELQALRRANERNGVAIRRGLDTVTTELNVLRGGGACTDEGVYDAGGQRNSTGAGLLDTRA